MDDRKSERIDMEPVREDDRPSSEVQSRGPSPLSRETNSPLHHRLQVYQAELEARNEELRRVRQELLESESSFRTLFNAADEALFVHDVATGEILDVNPAACAMYGFTPEEARRMRVAQFSSGEPGYTQQDAQRQIAKDLDHGRNIFEWHARKMSGECFWVEVTLGPVIVAGRTQVLGAVRDVTERRRTQNALADSRRKLGAAVRIAKLGYWEYDVASNLFTFDDDFYAIFRTTAKKVGGHTMSPDQYARRFVHPDDVHVVADEVLAVMTSDASVVERYLEHRILYDDGETGHIAVRSLIVRDEQGRVVKTYGANQDITQRKQAQEALRTERDFSESVIETAPVIVLVLDPEGRIVRFNRYMEDLSGYRLSEVQGKSWFDTFLPEPDRDRIRSLFKQATDDVRTCGNLNAIVTKDGRERLVEWHDKTLKDNVGNVTGLVAIGQDVTERRRAEQALQQAHDDLERRVEERTKELLSVNARLQEEIAERQRMEVRERQLEADLAHVGRLTTMGEMASGLAHELNQPLAAIVLQNEVIARMAAERPGSTPPEVLKALEFITKQSHRAGDLIRRMREFVRHAPKRAKVAIADVVSEVLPLVQRDLQASSIVLDVNIDDPPVSIHADKVQLQQVLLNLVRNAIEAMENTDAHHRRLSIQRRVGEQMVQVTVRDTGHGIAAENADKLFKTFYTTKADGMGLGLAICRSIIESHGGRIWATPNPERGTTFTFTLPIATEGEDNGSKTSRLSGG